MHAHQSTLVSLHDLPKTHHNTSSKRTYLLLWIGNGRARIRARGRGRRPVEDLGSPLAQLDYLRGVLGNKTLLAIGARRNVEIDYRKEEG
jgi:hypothetical protein